MTIYAVALETLEGCKFNGHFKNKKDAEFCCSYLNTTSQTESANKWHVIELEENKTDYAKLFENLLTENHLKEQLRYLNRGKN